MHCCFKDSDFVRNNRDTEENVEGEAEAEAEEAEVEVEEDGGNNWPARNPILSAVPR